MKETNCESCAWAEVAKEPRMIIKGDTTIYQSAESINCKCVTIKSMTFTDWGVYCSAYEPKEGLE